MSSISQYLEDALLGHLFKGVTLPALSTVHVGLHSAAGANETTNAWLSTELNSGVALGYSRVAVPAVDWSSPAGGIVSNDVAVAFTSASSAWGTITHASIWDASVAGNLLFYTALTAPKMVGVGDVVAFPVDNLTVSLD